MEEIPAVEIKGECWNLIPTAAHNSRTTDLNVDGNSKDNDNNNKYPHLIFTQPVSSTLNDSPANNKFRTNHIYIEHATNNVSGE